MPCVRLELARAVEDAIRRWRPSFENSPAVSLQITIRAADGHGHFRPALPGRCSGRTSALADDPPGSAVVDIDAIDGAD